MRNCLPCTKISGWGNVLFVFDQYINITVSMVLVFVKLLSKEKLKY